VRLYTRSEQQLEQDLKDIESQIVAGNRNIAVGAGDVTATKQLVNSLEQTHWRVLSALNRLNPDAWPIAADDVPVTRTRVSFGPTRNFIPKIY